MRFEYRYTRLAVVGETADPQSKVLAVGGVLTSVMVVSMAAVFFFGAATKWLTVSVVAMALVVAVAPFLRKRGKRFAADFSAGPLVWQSDDDKFWLPVWRIVSGATDDAATPPPSNGGRGTGAKASVAILGVALAAVGGFFALRGIWQTAQRPPAEVDLKSGGAVASSGGSAGADALGYTENDRAISAAKTLVYKNLKAPATARWASATVVARKSPRFLVHVLVDAQNDFGALIRNSYLVAVALEGGEKFSFSPAFGLQECNNPPSEAEIQVMRSMNDWEAPVVRPMEPPAPAEVVLRYEPELSELTGVLEVREFQNESDGTGERQLVLRLQRPVRVAAGSDIDQPEVEGVDVVTIVPRDSYGSLSAAQGRTATVRGRLFAATTAHHHTPVLLGEAELVP